MRSTRNRLAAAMVAVAFVAAACGSDDDEGATSAATADTGDAAETAGAGDTATESGGDDGGDDSGGAAGNLVVGASLPLTGPLGAFGPLIENGYRKAFDEINAAGGLDVGGQTYTVELKVVDNKSDGNEASAQARDLILGDGAVALLGAVTPPLTIPLSVAAEQNKVPFVTSLTPLQAWLGGNPDGWNYAFDFFFDEVQMTDLQYQTADLVETNKKVALFTDLEEDGIVMGGMWEEKAPAAGYEVVYRAEFPVGTTNFTTQVDEAQASGAEVVIAQVVPPDAIALLKQMKAAGYVPKVMFIEKGSSFGAWPMASEGLGDGISVAGWWTGDEGLPREAEMLELFAPDGAPVNADVAAGVIAYSAALVLFDAITAAGSTDADAIVAALRDLSGDYPSGHVDFGDDNASPVPAVMTQWSGLEQLYVTTAEGTAGTKELTIPVAGLGG